MLRASLLEDLDHPERDLDVGLVQLRLTSRLGVVELGLLLLLEPLVLELLDRGDDHEVDQVVGEGLVKPEPSRGVEERVDHLSQLVEELAVAELVRGEDEASSVSIFHRIYFYFLLACWPT